MGGLRHGWAVPAIAVAIAALAPVRAFAAPPDDAERKRMRDRFEEAVRAERAEHYDEALGILREVAAYKTTPGVVFHIANCEEHLGHLADALRDFARADGLAQEQGVDDVRRLAKPRIEALDPRVPRVTLKLPRGIGGIAIAIDGTALPPEQLANDVRLDPGRHELVAQAPGRRTFDQSFDLKERDAIAVAIDLPPSAATNAPVAAQPKPDTSNARGGGIPSGTWIAGGAAVGLAAGGAIVFAIAGAKNASGEEACPTPNARTCDPTDAQSVRSAVRGLDRVALGLWIGAGVAAGAAIGIWVVDRSKSGRASRTALAAGLGALYVDSTF